MHGTHPASDDGEVEGGGDLRRQDLGPVAHEHPNLHKQRQQRRERVEEGAQRAQRRSGALAASRLRPRGSGYRAGLAAPGGL